MEAAHLTPGRGIGSGEVVWGLLAERWCTQHRGGMGVAGGGSLATANGETLGYGVLWPRESTDISLRITVHMCDGCIKSRSIYFVIRTRPPFKHQFHAQPPLQNICFTAIQTAKNSHPNCKRTSLKEVPEPATTHTGPGQQARAQTHTWKEGRPEVYNLQIKHKK